jgi:hypothetical protein
LPIAFGRLAPRHVGKPACDHDHALPVEQERLDLVGTNQLIKFGAAKPCSPQELGHAAAIFVAEAGGGWSTLS